MNLNHYTYICHQASIDGGWWSEKDITDPMVHAAKIALIHSEVSEALEGIRKSTQDDHLPHRLAAEVELADTLIRVFDLAGALKLDLEGAVAEKMAYNTERLDHKAATRRAAGGKRF
jgi:NTP pyrophosphatase (non-canonical NTP hydrolase)